MQENEYARMFDLEDHYWWFIARRALALKLLRRHNKRKLERILDLGCGTGVVLGELDKIAPTFGFDFSPVALSFCRKRNLPRLVNGDAQAMPLTSNSFDAIVALDLFEHLADDVSAFSECLRTLRPGGILVLSVPAFMKLWGPHDVALMHHRRYRRKELIASLEGVGFGVRFSSYSVFLLFPVVAIVRFFEKRRKGKPEASLPALPNWLNSTLVRVQALESSLMSLFSLPWGSSVVVVAQKPATDQ